MRKKKNIILEKVFVEDYAAEGKSLGRLNGKVVFIENVVPGDVVDVRLNKNKKDWAEGFPTHFHSFSKERMVPFCQHFGVCGGCQWQMLPYEKQLQYKQQQVYDNLKRIGKVELPPFLPIAGAEYDKFYRNKLEYSFSTEEFTQEPPAPSNSPKLESPHPNFPPTGEGTAITQPSLVEKHDFFEEADPMLYGLMKSFVSTHRKSPTQAEEFLWQNLRSKNLEGYKFRRQHIVNYFIADFVCLSKKLIIEVDGLIHQLPENKINDEERTATLKQKGYEVIRFSNEEILNNIHSVLKEIVEKLAKLPFAEKKNYSRDFPPLGEQKGALGFHAKGFFSKVVNIKKCWLQPEPTNAIRNAIREFARERNFAFYNIIEHTGLLRTMQLRICTTGEIMVNIVFGEDDEVRTQELMNFLQQRFPQITTLLYTINLKKNDSIHDLIPQVYFGKGYVIEKLEEFRFKIGPKSFFQTNTKQAEKLYQITRSFAELTGDQVLYDLYCGTGSIGIFCSKGAKKIIGVELLNEAVEDAKLNAELNNINHALFIAGDVIDICTSDFIVQHGAPDVLITDPPRAGMNEKLVKKILEMEPPTVVYVSCNPATQARDLTWLDEKYSVTKVQPVDMFPHTHHIENVLQLKLKNTRFR